MCSIPAYYEVHPMLPFVIKAIGQVVASVYFGFHYQENWWSRCNWNIVESDTNDP